MNVRWQGFAVGFLGLTLLEVVVANPAASKRVGGLASGAGNLARKILSPAVPAFTTASSPSSSAPSSQPAPKGTGTAQPAPTVPIQVPGLPAINFNSPLPSGTAAM